MHLSDSRLVDFERERIFSNWPCTGVPPFLHSLVVLVPVTATVPVVVSVTSLLLSLLLFDSLRLVID